VAGVEQTTAGQRFASVAVDPRRRIGNQGTLTPDPSPKGRGEQAAGERSSPAMGRWRRASALRRGLPGCWGVVQF